jgi:hypothetical protein
MLVTLGWKSLIEKLVVSWVFVGVASGCPMGGSAIGPRSVPARHTTTFYIAIVSTTTQFS